MLKTLLPILLVSVFFLSAPSVDAKKMVFGNNKGKEVLTDRQTEQKHVNELKAAIGEVIKSQEQTNKLLQQMMQSMAKHAQVTQGMLRESLKKKAAISSDTESTKQVSIDTTPLEKLSRETNRLLKKLVEEQKWLSAIINSQQSEDAQKLPR